MPELWVAGFPSYYLQFRLVGKHEWNIALGMKLIVPNTHLQFRLVCKHEWNYGTFASTLRAIPLQFRLVCKHEWNGVGVSAPALWMKTFNSDSCVSTSGTYMYGTPYPAIWDLQFRLVCKHEWNRWAIALFSTHTCVASLSFSANLKMLKTSKGLA